ncbi:class I SAM-dependent methyltransferase [Desulfobacter latus]|uniref:Class I SAM-dependent methyltransferase n=1 Tax=Desulfobacter latus TaxID=2292 RepID=A0A850TB59_9BACT|nr:class I SAM-dependent methyltransferase [Desulfobacter latus]NWH06655.1 class I SAM-dependent methyltransferase [Desulfobacter latus]
MPKIESFEKYSDAYDQWFNHHPDLYAAEIEAIRRLIPSAGAEGMEVGVGTGKFAVPLGITVGVEPSAKMASIAKSQGINVYSGVAEDLPFSDGRFDFVMMVTTICFVDDIVKSFKEACRVLKNNGFILIGFVDKESELGRQYSEKKESSKFYKDATFFSVPEVLSHLNTAGFIVSNILQTLIPGEVPNTILEGFGKGAFVVVKGIKNLSDGGRTIDKRPSP